ARITFGAAVRAGPRDHTKAHVVHQFGEILELAQVCAAFFRFVVVPEDVSLNGVEARPEESLQPVAPEFARAARVVESGAEDESVFVMNGETVGVVADQARVFELLRALGRREDGEPGPVRAAKCCGQRGAESGLKKKSSSRIHGTPYS